MLTLENLARYPHKLGHALGKDLLLPVHDKWLHWCFNSTEDRALQAHRGSYKTTALAVGIVWYLMFNENARILVLRKTHEMAIEIVEMARKFFESEVVHDIYELLLQTKGIKTEIWTKTHFNIATKRTITPEFSVQGYGITGSLTGHHYDLIIADDIITKEDRYSKAKREFTKTIIRELVHIKDAKFGKIIYSGTVWHKNDGWETIQAKPIRYTIFDNPVQLSKDKIAQLEKETGDRSEWAANYELRHVASTGKMFADPNYESDFPPSKSQKILAYLDPAFGGKDYSALVIGFKCDELIWILAGYIWQGTIDLTYNIVERIYHEFEVSQLIVESNSAQIVILTEFRKRKLEVKERKNIKNKYLRMGDIKKRWDGIFFRPDINKDFMNQLLDISVDGTGTDHDDSGDALAGLVEELTAGRDWGYGKL